MFYLVIDAVVVTSSVILRQGPTTMGRKNDRVIYCSSCVLISAEKTYGISKADELIVAVYFVKKMCIYPDSM